MLFQAVFAGLSILSLASAQATVYLIRHGEKPDKGDGLNADGEQRAQCLVNVFGSSSGYSIGHIMAQTPQSGARLRYHSSHSSQSLPACLDGSQQRPYDTVVPLANSLGLTIDTSCQRDDQDCVANIVEGYSGPGNILICWEHDALTDIVKELGDKNAPDYDGDDFGVIWTDPYPYDDITNYSNEDCPGLGQ